MILTETEAQTRWCPVAIRPQFHQPRGTMGEMTAANRDTNGSTNGGARCIGSGCMAWCWTDPAQRVERTTASVSAQSARKGCCGLAHGQARHIA